MKPFFIIPVAALFTVLFHYASAEVLVNDNEFAGYFDSDGIYTVFGSVRNMESQSVLAKIQVTVDIGDNTFSKSSILPVIFPSKDMPFKFKFPQISAGDPILQNPQISYILTNSEPLNLEVNYDRTLVRHPDGHLTGFITNTGNDTSYNVSVYALVHNKNNEFLDEVQSTQPIPKMNPGDKAQFIMYPDPTIAKHVTYYSCFIPGTDNSVELWTQWNSKRFYFSILSIVDFTNQKFNEDDNSLYLDAANPWQIPFYANFMFPVGASNGDFKVFIDGKKINPLISIDNDTNNWHVAFNVDYGQHKVLISGFNSNYVPTSDEYFYLDSKLALTAWAGYSTFTISDSKLLYVLGIKGEYVPAWIKNTVGFMIYSNLPSDDIVNEIKYLKQIGIVR
ncbi:MAG: hypothetical protein ACREA3_03375 [Nitrosotalea sp.]